MKGRRPFALSSRVVLFALSLVTMGILLAPPAWCVTLYSVRPKDTLAKIAQKSGVSVDRLVRANPDLRQRPDLKIGQILVIPDGDVGIAHDDEDETPRSVVIHTKPLPTPTVTQMMALSDSDFENIAVVNEQRTREELIYAADGHERRPELASRRGFMVNQITLLARKMIGVPYVWGGTGARGLDCSGFTMRIYRLAGINIKRLADEQYYQGTPTDNPMPGDLVFFSTYLPGPSHVGIYLGNNYFIHASSSKGVTISNLEEKFFKKRYLGARRFF